jgi:TonB family protein
MPVAGAGAEPQPHVAPEVSARASSDRPVAWGTFLDPVGPSAIVESGDRLELSVPAGAYDLSSELGQVTAPRLVRPVDGDHSARVTVDELPEPPRGPQPGPRLPFHGAGLLLWKDERTYARLEAAVVPARDGSVVRYALFEVRVDGRLAGGVAAANLRLRAAPTELRLTRRDGELCGEVRQGGDAWQNAGRARLELPASLSVGIAAVNRSREPLRVGFTGFELTTGAGAPLPESGGGTPAAIEAPKATADPLTDFDQPPRVRRQARPKYPREAFDARIEGTVLVEALVDTKGRVVKVRVIESVPGLDEAALEAVRKWRFDPAIKGGKPVATIIHMPVKFLIY